MVVYLPTNFEKDWPTLLPDCFAWLCHRQALKTNPCRMKCAYNNCFYLFHVFCVLFRYLCYNLVKLTRFVNGDDINITLILWLLKLCIPLSGDVEMNPGPTHGDVFNQSISILLHNIRSLRNKIQDIANIVDEFDIICFTETHLVHSISDVAIFLSVLILNHLD